jgi:cysteine sulfinate desulfinase/cysteine desulfurase-like protein
VDREHITELQTTSLPNLKLNFQLWNQWNCWWILYSFECFIAFSADKQRWFISLRHERIAVSRGSACQSEV